MHLASPTVVPRGETQPAAPQGPQHSSTSFFTFLIALLILVFASAALVLRAVLLRRRLRRHVQYAIDAGMVFGNTPATQQKKPEMYEVYARAAGDVMDWHSLMPICATNVRLPQHNQVNSKPQPMTDNPSVRERLMQRLGRRSAPAPTPTSLPPPFANNAKYDEPSTLQVAVLIAMPSEHTTIPSLDSPPLPGSSEHEPRDASKNTNDNAVPDVLFGVSTFTVISDDGDP